MREILPEKGPRLGWRPLVAGYMMGMNVSPIRCLIQLASYGMVYIGTVFDINEGFYTSHLTLYRVEA